MEHDTLGRLLFALLGDLGVVVFIVTVFVIPWPVKKGSFAERNSFAIVLGAFLLLMLSLLAIHWELKSYFPDL